MAPNRAYVEALLEGVPLSATRSDLIRHARRAGDEEAAGVLERLPERRYSSLDEVGEALERVQPRWESAPRVPVVESDLPPGGERYGR